MNGGSSGARRIFLYNWPVYLATWGSSLVAAVAAERVGGVAGAVIAVAALVAIGWSAASLAVSYWIYDRSSLAGGAWVASLLPARVDAWATIDAGLDAEIALDDVVPGRCCARIDVYDGERVGAGSVRRARSTTPRAHAATARCPATALALADASCDLVAVVFTAHEIASAGDRERFFVEVTRALREGGRLLLVEHVRDAANFVAFGPGFLHFRARSEWLRLAGVARLRVAAEMRITPWVVALAMEKAP